MAIDPATLRLRYPAFANVADATIAYWLADAARTVDASYGADQEPATLALAAHGMASNGAPGLALTEAEEIGAGVTSFRSASVSISVSENAANRSMAEGYASTRYGVEFARFLRRHTGGPRLVGLAFPGCCG